MPRRLAGVATSAMVTRHAGELPGGQLNAGAGEESDQDGTGQEIGHEPEPGEAGRQMTRYRAYQAQLAGHTFGEIFGRATEFLKLAAANASSITDNSTRAAH
jgi:hypothetical protein